MQPRVGAGPPSRRGGPCARPKTTVLLLHPKRLDRAVRKVIDIIDAMHPPRGDSFVDPLDFEMHDRAVRDRNRLGRRLALDTWQAPVAEQVQDVAKHGAMGDHRDAVRRAKLPRQILERRAHPLLEGSSRFGAGSGSGLGPSSPTACCQLSVWGSMKRMMFRFLRPGRFARGRHSPRS